MNVLIKFLIFKKLIIFEHINSHAFVTSNNAYGDLELNYYFYSYHNIETIFIDLIMSYCTWKIPFEIFLIFGKRNFQISHF